MMTYKFPSAFHFHNKNAPNEIFSFSYITVDMNLNESRARLCTTGVLSSTIWHTI